MAMTSACLRRAVCKGDMNARRGIINSAQRRFGGFAGVCLHGMVARHRALKIDKRKRGCRRMVCA